MPTLKQVLLQATQTLAAASITTAKLDTELLLAHTLHVDKTWLIAHNDEVLNEERAALFDSLITRRLTREPVAYIVGKKEFYGREFTVTPDVLIPRPETEDLVDLVKKTAATFKHKPLRVIDIGCGSGCIGITVKLEHPALDVTLADISPAALAVAQENAENLDARVAFVQSDLLAGLPEAHFDLIVANLPYVDTAWEVSPELAHEPDLALYADESGLRIIRQCIEQASLAIRDKGYLLLEADPEQHKTIRELAHHNGLTHSQTLGYAISFVKQS